MGTVGLDVQRRDAQVAVVFQGDLDQLLQGRIVEELAPALFGGRDVRRLIRRVGRSLRVLWRYRRLRALVVRNQRATAEHEGGDRYMKKGLAH